MSWTNETHVEARRRWQAGEGIMAICRAIDCAPDTFARKRATFPDDFPARDRRRVADWSEADLDRAQALYEAGRIYPEIAAALGVSVGQMHYVAERHRDRFPPRSGNPAPATQEQIDAAARDWAAGYSVAEIAARIDRSPGSVSAIIGKDRQRFPPRGRHGRASVRLAGPGMTAPTNLPPKLHDYDFSGERLPDAEPVPFMTAVVADGCRFPVGEKGTPDGADMPCCGVAALPGKAWCAAHYRVVYRPVKTVAA